MANIVNHHDRRIMENTSFLEGHFERRGQLFHTVQAKTLFDRECFYKLRREALVKDLHITVETSPPEDAGIKDVYDDNALHFLHYFQPLHLIVGGIRFVRPTLHVGNYISFPSARIFPSVKEFIDQVDPLNCLEVSRFMVSEMNAHRMSAHLESLHYEAQEHLYPPKILYLLEMVYKVAREHNAHYLIGSFEAYLIRILKRMNLVINPLEKPQSKFHDLQPFYIPIEETMSHLEKKNPRIFHFLTGTSDNY